MRLNLPNSLTLLRIFLVPVLVVVLLAPPWATRVLAERWEQTGAVGAWVLAWHEMIATVIFLIAAATDFLDGYLARSRGQVTTLGKLLDPIADKLLTVSAFIALVELGLAPAWIVVVIVGREFAVSGMRSFAASRGIVIAARPLGKWKTVFQIIAIGLLMPSVPLGSATFKVAGDVALWISMVLALVSMLDYLAGFVSQVDFES